MPFFKLKTNVEEVEVNFPSKSPGVYLSIYKLDSLTDSESENEVCLTLDEAKQLKEILNQRDF